MANDNMRSSINLISDKNVVAVDTASSGYNYYGFMAKDGSWTILREKQDNTEYLYFVGATGFDTAWTNRETHTYEFPSGFPRA